MTAHSEHGASGCKRWWNCPGSVALTRCLPDESSAYAAEGTAAHELAALCLESGQDAIEYVGRFVGPVTFNGDNPVTGFTVDADMAEAVQVYLDHCRVILATSPDVVQHIEHRFTLESLNPPAPMFGTADFVASYGGWLWAVDLKYGQGVQVPAEGNPQLRYYALGALIGNPGVRYIRADIVQPRAPGGPAIRSVELDPVDLVEWSVELMDRARATLEPDAPLVPGEWCSGSFCKARGTCSARAQAAAAVAGVEFMDVPAPYSQTDVVAAEICGRKGVCGGDGIGFTHIQEPGRCPECQAEAREQITRANVRPTAAPVLPDPRLMTPDQVAHALNMADLLDGFLRDLRAAATAEISRGGTVPGWKLVPTRPSQSWRDDAEADAALEDLFGFGDERYRPRSVVSPAQARTLLAARLPGTRKAATEAARARLADLIVTASSGVTLAPDADARPALPAAGAEFLALPDHTVNEDQPL